MHGEIGGSAMEWKKGIDDYRRDVEQYKARREYSIKHVHDGCIEHRGRRHGGCGRSSIKRCGGWGEVYGLRI